MNNPISTALGIVDEKPTIPIVEVGDQSGDVDYVRSKMKTAIEVCVQMMPDLVSLAKASQDPDMYNSASNFMKAFTALNLALINAQKPRAGQKPNPPPEPQKPETVPQTELAFEGTTEQFLALILNSKLKEKVIVEAES